MWTHIKETSKSTLLALCEGNSSVTDEVPTKGTAAANAEKASIWTRHRGVIWIRKKMGNIYNYLLLHSYHSIKYIISIRELLNHKFGPARSYTKTFCEPDASSVWVEGSLVAAGPLPLPSVSFKEAIVGSVGITPTCFFRMPCRLKGHWLWNEDTSKYIRLPLKSQGLVNIRNKT